MTVEPDFELTQREFDFVWAHLGLGPMPYPVDVPSNGETKEDRARLRDETFDVLRDKGVLHDERVQPALADLLFVLAAPTVSVDTVGFLERPIRGIAAADRTQGVLVALADDRLSFAAIRPTALAASIVEVLPAGEAGPGLAISLPHQAMRRAVDGDDDDPFGGGEERDVLVANGVSEDDASTVIELAERRVGGGQFGITTTGRASRIGPGSRVRATTMVTWFDTNEGRYLMVHDGAWVSVAPADGGRIANRIDVLLQTA
ncbi:ESX secretion-associated protein EspG [Actinophytocola gossypii]|uniref:ESX secretion-associated protein EspG n=1 Tax=Actinophytocola gossypii TaxID=2812003 RepID=A0ABT2JCB5_9PSEU|nr:ESX secretion-associated protein EspG [Actinophytocola gossypii]MCT2585517.1 ESX secretion-associated protein EspG [Actinophytocola gossypii]